MTADVSNLPFIPFFQRYVVGLHRRLDVYSVSTAKIEFTANVRGRVNDVAFSPDGAFAFVASDAPDIDVYDLAANKRVQQIEGAHERRVR